MRPVLLAAALAIASLPLSAKPASAQQAPAIASLTLHAEAPGPKIDRRIFSQFAEHLGSGIYGGIWVGQGSRIANTRGYRNDVLAALESRDAHPDRWRPAPARLRPLPCWPCSGIRKARRNQLVAAGF